MARGALRGGLCLLAAVVGLGEAAPDTDPPVISLDLTEGAGRITHVYTSAQKSEICHTKEERQTMLQGGEQGWADKQCAVDGKAALRNQHTID
jgi:hypothetical protein